MIVGVGTDLIDIRRIARALERHGERFERRCFTEVESARARAKRDPAATYAKRFAAKEACAKALGTGLARGVFWRDMQVANSASGQPGMTLTGGAAARLAALTPPGYSTSVHLSMTDDFPLAQAFVILSAEKVG